MPENDTSPQQAVVDQSSEVRDPADDSGLVDDPAAAAQTYPGVFDSDPQQAKAAIDAEARSDHSPREADRSTDNARDRQI